MKDLYELPNGAEVQQSGFSSLELVEVSHQDKLRLFQVGIKASQEAWPKTENVLARLKHFHPSTAQEFGLKDYALSQGASTILMRIPRIVSAGVHEKH